VTVGDIHWIELPPGTGHEQSGRRPAVVVQDRSDAGALPVVLVVPLTTATATLRFPGIVLVHPDSDNGLRSPRSPWSFNCARSTAGASATGPAP
jgi:mRNA-degrading endonuclease toxin of MazEF toxin-antitoxin module